jgi:hypothetical protein
MWKTPKDQAIENIKGVYRFDVKPYGFDNQMQILQKIVEEEQRIIEDRRVVTQRLLIKAVVALTALLFLVVMVLLCIV